MKKTLIAVSAFVAALVLSGCTSQPVDQPGSRRPEGTWNSITGTLGDVRYYNSNVDAVYKAAEKSFRELGIFVTGYTQYKSGYTLYGRAVGDYKVTVDVTSRQVSTRGTDRAPIPYTEVSVSYGAFGDLAMSLQIVSKISSNLPSEK
ncbi:MAG: DUF3568 family protein [Opitutales bacterium]|nr:DUF3568 family protein [Opitutales bacterium]MBQ9758253.1 DUF3568 family protein [Opitutales bacterium]